MGGRILQLLVKLAVVTALLWVGRRALIRWVNGPEARPSPAPWPSLDKQDWGPTVGPAEPAAGTATAGPADLAAGTATAGPAEPAAGTATAGPADLAAGVATGGPAESSRGTLTPASANGDRRATPQQTTAPSATEQAAAPPATTSTGPITANAPAEAELDRAWLPADESGACPPTHPVKAKRSTRLYREPGTAAYDRARPDRCYVNAEAAEADGFTRAKR